MRLACERPAAAARGLDRDVAEAFAHDRRRAAMTHVSLGAEARMVGVDGRDKPGHDASIGRTASFDRLATLAMTRINFHNAQKDDAADAT
jgi:hypothetical protein